MRSHSTCMHNEKATAVWKTHCLQESENSGHHAPPRHALDTPSLFLESHCLWLLLAGWESGLDAQLQQ